MRFTGCTEHETNVFMQICKYRSQPQARKHYAGRHRHRSLKSRTQRISALCLWFDNTIRRCLSCAWATVITVKIR